MPGGSPGPGGVVVSQHALRQTPPVNRITDRCKNITFATSLRMVIRQCEDFSSVAVNLCCIVLGSEFI